MIFQDCDNYASLERRDQELIFVRGVSKYADKKMDATESIAEAYVKRKNKEEIPEDAIKLLEQYVDRWLK